MADTKLFNQGIGLVAQIGIGGCKHAAEHVALVLLRRHNQIVTNSHLSKHLQCLEGSAHTAAVERQGTQLGHVFTFEFNAAFIGRALPQHAVEQGGFAGTVGANHTKDFARANFKGHTAYSLNGAVGLFQIVNL